LWQLKEAGMIDHMTMSFFVHLDDARFPDSPSTVKFGSWDSLSIADGTEPTMIRTVSEKTWDVKCNFMNLDKTDAGLSVDGTLVRFDPGLPYLYLPTSIFTDFVKFMNGKYGASTCDPVLNVCKFPKACSEVQKTFGASSDFEFRLYDVRGKYTFKIKTEHMMVEGKYFQDPSDTCYVPIFNHKLTRTEDDRKTIFVGNTFMQDYYVVYDMSQWEERKYLQVGLAK